MDVRNLLQTCPARPAQWEGNTEDGRPVYIHYRHGHLLVLVGEPGEGVWDACARGTEILSEQLGDPQDGELTWEAMLHRLVELELPEVAA